MTINAKTIQIVPTIDSFSGGEHPEPGVEAVINGSGFQEFGTSVKFPRADAVATRRRLSAGSRPMPLCSFGTQREPATRYTPAAELPAIDDQCPASCWDSETKRWDLPRICAIAVDVDGTLLNSNGRLSSITLEALRHCVRKGILLYLATARPRRLIFREGEAHGEVDFLKTRGVFYNGAVAVDDSIGLYKHFQELRLNN